MKMRGHCTCSPTKALTQDQLEKLQGINAGLAAPGVPRMYDGDTPASQRPGIRKNARILLTNPDMPHNGTPSHTLRGNPFVNLKMSSWVTHRPIVARSNSTWPGLRRVARYYREHPQSILTSATIGTASWPRSHGPLN